MKRLDDAIRDHDPIRAVILGTASNSNGRTAGIASPNSASQALAIRAAYARAGITDFNLTSYLECHGTGTQAGDPTEINGIGSVFAPTRSADNPLIIGSVKSNVGHAEPAAGNSALLKAVLSIENGTIPGTPTFINPSPKIDFIGNKVKAFRTTISWPKDAPRRVSINSFGVGGSNAHAIVEAARDSDREHHISSYASPEDEFTLDDEEEAARPSILVLSANDATSLRNNIEAFGDHLINPRVKVNLSDLAYTLSERRTRLWHRAFITTQTTGLDERSEAWTVGKKSPQAPTYGFIFTGQGAQWPQMGKDLLQFFPWTQKILEELDTILQSLPEPPKWSLVSELTESRSSEHLRQPEFSQPLVTALQLCLIAVLETWNIKPRSVVGHSSGEIAAAYSAGLLDRAGAIIAAFYRGRAALNRKNEVARDVGMLAVGLGAEAASEFLGKHVGQAWIACFNSPSSVTVSGRHAALEALREEIAAAGHFARRLQVDLAYHSELMNLIGQEYEKLLTSGSQFSPLDSESAAASTGDVSWFSSVTTSKKATPADASYWKTNMVSAVRFDGALKALLEDKRAPDFLIEIGPSGALAGPVSQILKSLPPAVGGDVTYCASWSRGQDAGKALFDVAGRLFVAGAPIDLKVVNQYEGNERIIVDLPNYKWNHTVKYWKESAASKDWRFRKYVAHDLLGSKILGSSWHTPTWRAHLNVANVPYLMDHKMGGDTIMPGCGFLTMGVEAMYQKHCALLQPEDAASIAPNDLSYRFRNVHFNRAMVLEEGKELEITTTLTKVHGGKDWHEFRISTSEANVVAEHCFGLVRIQDPIDERLEGENAAPLKSPQAPKIWYKQNREWGNDFGPTFQRLIKYEAINGQRTARSLMSLSPPAAKHSPQSYYPIHPAALDGCLQTASISNVMCDRTKVKSVMVPSLLDDLVINKLPLQLNEGRSVSESVYSGRGRLDTEKSWVANTSTYDAETGQLVVRFTGLNYIKLDVAPRPDGHTFHHLSWKPDITYFTQDQMMYLETEEASNKLDTVIDLIAHKKPALNVLEVNLDEANTSCLWFGANDQSARAAYARYDFTSSNAKALVNVQTQYEGKENASFSTISPEKEGLGLSTEVTYDLAILHESENDTSINTEDLLKNLKPLLSSDAYTLTIRSKTDSVTQRPESPSPNSFEEIKLIPSPESPGTPSQSSGSLVDGPTSSISSAAWDHNAAKKSFASAKANTVGSRMEIAAIGNSNSATLWSSNSTHADTDSCGNLLVVRLAKTTPKTLPPTLQSSLEASGWTITQQVHSFSKPTDGSVVLILDELWNPVLTQANEKQWETIKGLVSSGSPLLWVTKGAQGSSTNPDNAMISGLFRVVRQEDSTAQLTTLDVQSSTSPATCWAIEKVLGSIRRGDTVENEYMERDGLLYIPRIMPDTAVNNFKSAEAEGLEPVLKDFHGTEVKVQLRAERLGTLQSLMWTETELEEGQLEPGHVEVEVVAAGVNFKDVAITMGIVPDDEHNLGLECGGVVKRLSPDVKKFKVGDRVCMLRGGSFANRVRVPVERCHLIPGFMSFEEAATIPSVYLCSLYAMYHLGSLREGQVRIVSCTLGKGSANLVLVCSDSLSNRWSGYRLYSVGSIQKGRGKSSFIMNPTSERTPRANSSMSADLCNGRNRRKATIP